MPATRTQIYLTADQRRRLDARRRRERRTLASLIREAVDAFLADNEQKDYQAVLDATFGIAPDFEVPPRSEWEERFERIYRERPDRG